MVRALVALLALVTPPAQGTAAQDELIPAGSINSVFGSPPIVVVAEDEPGVLAHARGIRDRFFAGAELLTDVQALARGSTAFADANLIVYGTPDSAWLAEHAAALPFGFDAEGAWVQERRFVGEHLRVIAAVRNPANPERRAVVYAARRARDVPGINDLFHGPTEWLVANGRETLATGSYSIVRPLSVEELEADLDFVVASVLGVHPATTDGPSPEVAAAIAEARAAIDAPAGDALEREAFWLVVNRLLTSLGDAHTSLGRSGGAESVQLPVRWLREGLVVRRDAGELGVGDRVRSLGGRSEAQLLDAFAAYVSAETRWWVRHRAERLLMDAGALRSLGLLAEGGLALVVERGEKERKLVLPVVAGLGSTSAEERPAWVRFEIDEEASLGVFTLDTCRNDETYRARLRAFFEAVHERAVERVAVDLRRNSGGNSSVTDEFLRYLDVDEYQSYSGDVRVSEASAAQRGDGGLTPGLHEFRNPPRQNARVAGLPPFAGELYVLTGPGTFSSGSWFAVVLSDNGLAEIVGEPTGNAPSAYGDLLSFTLPESGFTFSMSFKRWLRPDLGRDPASTLEPDRLIPLTAEDLVAGRDPVLEFLRGRADRTPRRAR